MLKGKYNDYYLELSLLILYIILSFTAQGFISIGNQLNILRNVSTQGIIAFGMTILIISGEIDLSIGSMVAFSGCVLAWLTRSLTPILNVHLALVIAMLVALSVGLIVGWSISIFRSKYNIPSFIISLGFLTILFGGANLLTKGFPIAPFPKWFSFIGSGTILKIPFPVYILIIVFTICYIISKKTIFGRSLYAVGGNMKAANVSGIPIWEIKKKAFILTTFLACLAGIIVASQIMSGNANTARGWEMDVIASVIIGGAALSGGSGRIEKTLIGIIFLGVIINGMTLLNVSEYWQYVVRGSLILGAVMLNQIRTR